MTQSCLAMFGGTNGNAAGVEEGDVCLAPLTGAPREVSNTRHDLEAAAVHNDDRVAGRSVSREQTESVSHRPLVPTWNMKLEGVGETSDGGGLVSGGSAIINNYYDRGNALIALAAGLTPLIVMLICISWLRNVWAALITMHLVMVCFMVGHVGLTYRRRLYYICFFKAQILLWRRQVVWFVAAVVAGSCLYFGYCLLRQMGIHVADFRQRCLSVGLDLVDDHELAMFGVYFCVINPIIEELFWRLYLIKEFGCRFFRREDARSDSSASERIGAMESAPSREELLQEAELESTCFVCPKKCPKEDECRLLYHCESDQHASGLVFRDVRLTEVGSLACASLYASYHVVVVYHMLGPLFGVLAFAIVLAIGRLLHFLRNTRPFGILTAVGLHIGIDIGTAITVLNIVGGLWMKTEDAVVEGAT